MIKSKNNFTKSLYRNSWHLFAYQWSMEQGGNFIAISVVGYEMDTVSYRAANNRQPLISNFAHFSHMEHLSISIFTIFGYLSEKRPDNSCS